MIDVLGQIEQARAEYTASIGASNIERTKVAAAKEQQGIADDKMFEGLDALTDAYETAFAGGIVIERVLKPDDVEYRAGYRDTWAAMMENGAEDYEWYPLDTSHAATIAGKIASVESVSGPKFYEVNKTVGLLDESPAFNLRFEIPGIFGNENARTGLIRDDDETQYSGTLSAIEWRLPTADEVAEFGKVAVQGT